MAPKDGKPTIGDSEFASRRLRATLSSIGDAVISTDGTGRVEFLNPAAEQLTGWPSEEAAGRPLNEVFRILREDDRSPAECPVDRVLREGTVVGLANHTLLVARDGREIPIADSGAPIRDETGGIEGVVLVFRDQTAERRAQRLVKEARDFAESIVETVREPLLVLDEELRVQSANRNFYLLFRVAEKETVGKRVYELGNGQWDIPALRALLEEVLPENSHFDGFEVEHEFDHLGLRTMLLNARRLRRAEGEPGLILLAIEDVTDRRSLEQQLFRAQKLSAIGRLAGGIAHDFNNLLTVIGGYGQILSDHLGEDHPLHAKAREIQRASSRAGHLVRQLLAFSRRQVLNPKTLDLNTVLVDTDTMLRRLLGEDVRLVTIPEPGIWSVSADPAQLEQVLVNLAVNARDAMPEGGTLTFETRNVLLDESYASRHAGARPGPHVMLAVSDTGCGIPRSILGQIFDPFFTTKPDGKGTGLGLSTVYGIVKQSGGSIYVYSEPGKGTSFKIYLPAVEEQAEPLLRPAPPGEIRGGSETILLVEDAAGVRSYAAEVLETAGYRVFEAEDGHAGLAVLEEHGKDIDLLLTDVVMPGLGGAGLAEAFRQLRPDAPVLFTTGYTDNAVRHGNYLDPGVILLPKPFSPDDLLRKVREVLDAG